MSLLFSMLASTVAASAPPADPLVTDYHIERLEPLKDGLLPSGGMWLSKWKDWIMVEQLPATIRDKPSKGRAIFRMSIDRTGHLTGCDTIGSENVDVGKAACRAISGNPTFPTTYAAPGQPISDQWTMALVWETLTTSAYEEAEEARRHMPRPPPPPLLNAGTWPPLYPPHALVIATLPDIATVAPRTSTNAPIVRARCRSAICNVRS